MYNFWALQHELEEKRGKENTERCKHGPGATLSGPTPQRVELLKQQLIPKSDGNMNALLCAERSWRALLGRARRDWARLKDFLAERWKATRHYTCKHNQALKTLALFSMVIFSRFLQLRLLCASEGRTNCCSTLASQSDALGIRCSGRELAEKDRIT